MGFDISHVRRIEPLMHGHYMIHTDDEVHTNTEIAVVINRILFYNDEYFVVLVSYNNAYYCRKPTEPSELTGIREHFRAAMTYVR